MPLLDSGAPDPEIRLAERGVQPVTERDTNAASGDLLGTTWTCPRLPRSSGSPQSEGCPETK